MLYDASAFKFETNDPTAMDYVYFTFVTMTTLGYGDITPELPFAKSLAVLICTSGQIYVAVIIAMLVGKYAGDKMTKFQNQKFYLKTLIIYFRFKLVLEFHC
ncbi:MAG: potassium channel family protein [Bacteroidales bacterium]